MEVLGYVAPEKSIEEETKSTLRQHTGGGRSDMASTSRCVATLSKILVDFHFISGCFQKTLAFLFRRVFAIPRNNYFRVLPSYIPGFG